MDKLVDSNRESLNTMPSHQPIAMIVMGMAGSGKTSVVQVGNRLNFAFSAIFHS